MEPHKYCDLHFISRWAENHDSDYCQGNVHEFSKYQLTGNKRETVPVIRIWKLKFPVISDVQIWMQESGLGEGLSLRLLNRDLDISLLIVLLNQNLSSLVSIQMLYSPAHSLSKFAVSSNQMATQHENNWSAGKVSVQYISNPSFCFIHWWNIAGNWTPASKIVLAVLPGSHVIKTDGLQEWIHREKKAGLIVRRHVPPQHFISGTESKLTKPGEWETSTKEEASLTPLTKFAGKMNQVYSSFTWTI